MPVRAGADEPPVLAPAPSEGDPRLGKPITGYEADDGWSAPPPRSARALSPRVLQGMSPAQIDRMLRAEYPRAVDVVVQPAVAWNATQVAGDAASGHEHWRRYLAELESTERAMVELQNPTVTTTDTLRNGVPKPMFCSSCGQRAQAMIDGRCMECLS